jgi:hypothetical protein
MSRIKERLSKLVASQLPEFIQSDYPTFIAFLEAYYEFLEQDQNAQEILQNAVSYRDIDRTTTEFIEYFLREYCDNIPRDVLSDKTILTKYIKDLYNFKGSEKSFYLLFQLLYKEKVNLYYPRDDILIPSSGTWQQSTIIQLETLNGNPDTAVNVPGVILSTSTVNPITLKSKKTVTAVTNVVTGAISTSTTIFDFEIDRIGIPVNIGDIVEVGGYRGKVLGVPSSVSVIKPGIGFKIGDTFEVKSFPRGIGAYVKVTSVDENGGVKNAELLRVGSGYDINFFATIVSQVLITPPTFLFNTATGNVSIVDQYVGLSDFGRITKPTYADGSYVAGDYCDEVVRVFNYGPVNQGDIYFGAEEKYEAVLDIKVGSRINYPGYYKTNKGFLSDSTINVADANYYTPYTYVVVSNKRLQDYKRAILDILHPAGTNLIGELRMLNEIDAIPTVGTTFDFLRTTVLDIFSTSDIATKQVTKVRSSNTTPSDNVFSKVFAKVLTTNQTSFANVTLRHLTRYLANISNITVNVENIISNVSKVLSTVNALDDNSSANINIIRGDAGDLLVSNDLAIFNISTVYESNTTVASANTIANIIINPVSLSSQVDEFLANVNKVLGSNSSINDDILKDVTIVKGIGEDEVFSNDLATINFTSIQSDNQFLLSENAIFTINAVLNSVDQVLDNLSSNINIVKTNNVAIQDNLVVSVDSLVLSSNVNNSDSGSIFLSNYSNIPNEYFAEQYVGDLTTF